jgi:hypothetical protein
LGLLPRSGEEDDEEVGEHPEEITPTGSTGGSVQGEEVGGIGEDGGKKDETQDETKMAKPCGARSARAEEEGERENEIADNVENEDLP